MKINSIRNAGATLTIIATMLVLSSFGAERPNIIVILGDDYSAKEISGYGGPIKTPTMDRMGEQGVQFMTAWSAPLCGPSRAMVQTGKYPCNHGYYDNRVVPKVSFNQDKRHLPILRMAKAAGYRTGMYGKVHHDRNRDASLYGMDDYCLWQKWKGHDGLYVRYWHPSYVANGKGIPTKPGDFGPDIVFGRLKQFIDDNKDKPFFVYWPSTLAHGEKDPRTQKWHKPEMPEVDAAGKRTGRNVKGSLASMVRCMDGLVGDLITHLERNGLLENTIIFYTADNGSPGYGKGKYESERGMRVPFVVYGGPVKRVGKTAAMIDFTDIWPTIAELVGYKGKQHVDGHSFAPLLLGKPFEPRTYVKMQLNNARWLRSKDWLLDGYGHFWDCRGLHDESKFKDVTHSKDPVVIEARKAFEIELQKTPLPNYDDPLTKASWQEYRKGTKPVEVFRPSYLKQ